MSESRRPGCVLVLGGTAEARQLAAMLDQLGVLVTSSLAGRTEQPHTPPGEVRIGGFGGPDGLGRWLVEQQIAAVIDATHPFAHRISASAASACAMTGVPLARFDRPPWPEQPGDRWHRVDDLTAAAEVVPRLGRRVLLTIGRQQVSAFAAVTQAWFLIRCIEPPAGPLPPDHAVVLARGPFTLCGELALLDAHAIDLIVTRDSGGAATEPKLDAARHRGVPVIVVQRPAPLAGTTVASADEAVTWLRTVLAFGGSGESQQVIRSRSGEC